MIDEDQAELGKLLAELLGIEQRENGLLFDPQEPIGQRWYHEPEWLLTGDGMVVVVEAMRGRGYRWAAAQREEMYAEFVQLEGDGSGAVQGRYALPEAVCLAALKALAAEVKA